MTDIAGSGIGSSTGSNNIIIIHETTEFFNVNQYHAQRHLNDNDILLTINEY